MPLRRYLRVSKYQALEVRVHVLGSDTTWFTERMLRTALDMAKPLIVQKLKEEQDAKKNRKPTKDVLKAADFSATMFLKPGDNRHTILNTAKRLDFSQARPATPRNKSFDDSSPLFIASDDEDTDVKDKPSLHIQYNGLTVHNQSLWLIITRSALDDEVDNINNTRNAMTEEWVQLIDEQA